MSQIPAGYKRTEVGVIPDDWEVNKLEEYFSFISYGFTNPMPSVTSGVYMITAANINHGRILYETARCTTQQAFDTLLTAKSKPQENDLLLTKDGTLGRVALVDDTQICINQSVAIIRPNAKIDPLFLSYLLQSPYYQRKMLEDAGGSTIKHIYITIVNLMLIGVPPTLAEQRAIADALSDVDAQITALDALIAKKRDLKQGTMQGLLTGAQRLPGFSGAWEVKRLGEITTIVNGGTPKTSINEYWDGDILWCTPTDITRTNGKYLLNTERTISQLGLQNSSAQLLPTGTILLCTRATIGEVKIATSEVSTNQGFKSLICNDNVSNEFLYYVILTMKPKMIELAIGSTFLELSKNSTAQLEINLPPFEEQRAITSVLSDIDGEISALEAQRQKTLALKQGMMQDLLTGKVRLL